MSKWQDVVQVHRLEYPFPINYLCHAVLGACYAASSVQQLFTIPVLLSIIANLLPIIGGNLLNTAADVSTDAHNRDKRHIARAALNLGCNHVMSWAAIELAFALAVATAIAWWLDRALIAVAVALTIALCLLYNLEPVRLKRRGLANPLTLGAIYGTLPSLVSYATVRPNLTVPMWLIFIGVGTLVAGRALWWAVPDQIGDQATGMTTPTVQYGAFPTIVIACVTTATGLGLVGWGLWSHYGLPWALVGIATNGDFLLRKLTLLRRLSDYTVLDTPQIRRQDLSSIMVTDLLLVLLPLATRGT
ncbi:MAG: UbiA prenyltransferase family protein [Pseudonocardiaceae bacterium]